MGEKGGINLHLMAANSPLNYFDPLGHSWAEVVLRYVAQLVTTVTMTYHNGYQPDDIFPGGDKTPTPIVQPLPEPAPKAPPPPPPPPPPVSAPKPPGGTCAGRLGAAGVGIIAAGGIVYFSDKLGWFEDEMDWGVTISAPVEACADGSELTISSWDASVGYANVTETIWGIDRKPLKYLYWKSLDVMLSCCCKSADLTESWNQKTNRISGSWWIPGWTYDGTAVVIDGYAR